MQQAAANGRVPKTPSRWVCPCNNDTFRLIQTNYEWQVVCALCHVVHRNARMVEVQPAPQTPQ